MSETFPEPDAGQTWARPDGSRVVILGRDARGWVVQNLSDGALVPDSYVRVAAEHLARLFSWVACDHADFCCRSHDAHASPHRACILR